MTRLRYLWLGIVLLGVLTALFLVTGYFGADPISEVGVAPPVADQHPDLRISVEVSGAPVPLDCAIPMMVWLENTSDRPLIVCGCLDGSRSLDRNPTYRVRLFDTAGREVPYRSRRWCGTFNPVREADFFRLQPGERVNAFDYLVIFDIPFPNEYPSLRPGPPYTLTVTYKMTGGGGPGNIPQQQEEGGVQALFDEALPCEITSPPVTVRFSEATSTVRFKRLALGVDVALAVGLVVALLCWWRKRARHPAGPLS